MNEFKRAVLFKAMNRRTGETLGMQAVSSNLKTLMQENKTLMRELLTPQEFGVLSRLTQSLDSINWKPDKLGRNSGTPGGLIRWMRQQGSRVPVLGPVFDLVNFFGDARMARAAMQPVRSAPQMPVISAVAAAENPARAN